MQKCWVWLKVGQTIKHVVNMTFQIDNGGGVNSHFRGEDHTHTHTQTQMSRNGRSLTPLELDQHFLQGNSITRCSNRKPGFLSFQLPQQDLHHLDYIQAYTNQDNNCIPSIQKFYAMKLYKLLNNNYQSQIVIIATKPQPQDFNIDYIPSTD